jgi:hypothetical protein
VLQPAILIRERTNVSDFDQGRILISDFDQGTDFDPGTDKCDLIF